MQNEGKLAEVRKLIAFYDFHEWDWTGAAEFALGHDVCPTCGSDNPEVRKCGGGLRSECQHGHEDCPDEFHTDEK